MTTILRPQGPARVLKQYRAPALVCCDTCRTHYALPLVHMDRDDTITCWECVRGHFWRTNDAFTAAECHRLADIDVPEAEIRGYALRRVAYVASVVASLSPAWWLARATWSPLGFDWRRDVCPECQRPAELPDPERPCSACRVDELERVREERRATLPTGAATGEDAHA